MRRYKGFEYERREADEIQGYEISWTSQIYSSEGAQYHCWLPKGLTRGQENHRKQMFRRMAQRQGDPVLFTWDYVPEQNEGGL